WGPDGPGHGLRVAGRSDGDLGRGVFRPPRGGVRLFRYNGHGEQAVCREIRTWALLECDFFDTPSPDDAVRVEIIEPLPPGRPSVAVTVSKWAGHSLRAVGRGAGAPPSTQRAG